MLELGQPLQTNISFKFIDKGYKNIESAPSREGDIKHSCANIDLLRNTGWEPKIQIENGIEQLFKFWDL